MLDFRIHTFLEVCKDMNYTRAAQRLNLTQPAVSQHIRWLEEMYGVTLFVSRGKRMQLTPAGEMLRNSTATIQHDLQILRDRMQQSGDRKVLRAGFTLTIAEFEIAEVMASFLVKDPAASMILSVGNTKELLRELEEGNIDFALVEGNFPREVYQSELYAREPYIAVCPPGHPLSSGSHSVFDLLPYRLITREPGSGSRNILENYLQTRSLSVNSFYSLVEAGSIGLIKQLVGHGGGISFLYETAARKELEAGELARIDVTDMHIIHDLSFIWRENSIFNEEYLKIFHMLKDQKQEKEELV